MEQVEVGLRGSGAAGQQQRDGAQYAEGGSLAQDIREKEQKKMAGETKPA